MAGTPIAGFNSRVQIGGVNFNVDKWSVTPQIGDIPSTNFESGGYEEGITGNSVAEIEFSGFYDEGNPPFTTGGLTAGVKTTELRIYVKKTTNSYFRFPEWRLLSAPTNSDADNKRVEFSIRARSNGIWYYPAA